MGISNYDKIKAASEITGNGSVSKYDVAKKSIDDAQAKADAKAKADADAKIPAPIKKARQSRDTKEAAYLQYAAKRAAESGDVSFINKAKNILDLKRRGKEVPKDYDTELLNEADKVFLEESKVNMLKKSYGDTSFDPSPAAKEWGTFDRKPNQAPTKVQSKPKVVNTSVPTATSGKPTQAQGGTKTANANIVSPAQQIVSAVKPTEQIKAPVATVDKNIAAPPIPTQIIAPPPQAMPVPKEKPIIKPEVAPKPVGKLNKEGVTKVYSRMKNIKNAIPGVSTRVSNDIPDDDIETLCTGYKTENELYNDLRKTFGDVDAKAILHRYNKNYEKNQLKQSVEAKIKPAIEQDKKQYEALKKQKTKEQWAKEGIDIDNPNLGEIIQGPSNSFANHQISQATHTKQSGDSMVRNQNQDEKDKRNELAKEYDIRMRSVKTAEEAAKVKKEFETKVANLDNQFGSSSRRKIITDNDVVEFRMAKEDLHNKMIKSVEGNKVTTASADELEAIRKQIMEMYDEEDLMTAIAGSESAASEGGFANIVNGIRSLFSDNTRLQSANGKDIWNNTMLKLIDTARKRGGNLELEYGDSDYSDLMDFASMGNLDMGIGSIGRSQGRDLNGLGWYQNAKDFVTGKHNVYMTADYLNAAITDPEKLGNVLFGGGTSDRAAKQLLTSVLLRLHPEAAKNIGDEKAIAALIKADVDANGTVDLINGITDTAMMLLPVGSMKAGATTQKLATKAIKGAGKEVARKGEQLLAKGLTGLTEAAIDGSKVAQKGVKTIGMADAAVSRISTLGSQVTEGIKETGTKVSAMINKVAPVKEKVNKVISKLDKNGFFTTDAFKERTKFFQERFGTTLENAVDMAKTSFAAQLYSNDPEAMENAVNAAMNMTSLSVLNQQFGRMFAHFSAPVQSILKKADRILGDKKVDHLTKMAQVAAYELGGVPASIVNHGLQNDWDYRNFNFLKDTFENFMFAGYGLKSSYKGGGGVISDLNSVLQNNRYKKRYGDEKVSTTQYIADLVGKDTFTTKEAIEATSMLTKVGIGRKQRKLIEKILKVNPNQKWSIESFKDNPELMEALSATHGEEGAEKSIAASHGDTIYLNKDLSASEYNNFEETLLKLAVHEGLHKPTLDAIKNNPLFVEKSTQALSELEDYLISDAGQKAMMDDDNLMFLVEHMRDEDGGWDLSEVYSQLFETNSVLWTKLQENMPHLKQDLENILHKEVFNKETPEDFQDMLTSAQEAHAMAINSLDVAHVEEEKRGVKGGDSIDDNIKSVPVRAGFKDTQDLKKYYIGKDADFIYDDLYSRILEKTGNEAEAKKIALDTSQEIERLEEVPIFTIKVESGTYKMVKESRTGQTDMGKQIDNVDYIPEYWNQAMMRTVDDMREFGYTGSKTDILESIIKEVQGPLGIIHEKNVSITNSIDYKTGKAYQKSKINGDGVGLTAKDATPENRLLAMEQGVFLTPQGSARAMYFPSIKEQLDIVNSNASVAQKVEAAKRLADTAGKMRSYGFFRAIRNFYPHLATFEGNVSISNLAKDPTNFIKKSAKENGFNPDPQLVSEFVNAWKEYIGTENSLLNDAAFDRTKIGKFDKNGNMTNESRKALVEMVHGAVADLVSFQWDPVGVNRIKGGKHQVKYVDVMATRAMMVASKNHADRRLGLDGKDSEAYYQDRNIYTDGDDLVVYHAIIPPEVAKLLSPEKQVYFTDPAADGGIYVNNDTFDVLSDLKGIDKEKPSAFLKLKAADVDLINKAGWHRDDTGQFDLYSIDKDGKQGKKVAMFAGQSAFKAKAVQQKNKRRIGYDNGNWIELTPENRIVGASSPEFKEAWTQDFAAKVNAGRFPEESLVKRNITGKNGYSFVGESHNAKGNQGFAWGLAGAAQLAYLNSPLGKELIDMSNQLAKRVRTYYDYELSGYGILDDIASNSDLSLTPNQAYKAGIAMEKLAAKMLSEFKDATTPNKIRDLYSEKEYVDLLHSTMNSDGTINPEAFRVLAVIDPNLAGKERGMTMLKSAEVHGFIAKQYTSGFQVTMGLPQNHTKQIADGLAYEFDRQNKELYHEEKILKDEISAFEEDTDFMEFSDRKNAIEKERVAIEKWLANTTDKADKENALARLRNNEEGMRKLSKHPEYENYVEWAKEKNEKQALLEKKTKELESKRKALSEDLKQKEQLYLSLIDPKTGTIKAGARLPDGSIPILLGKNEIGVLNKHKKMATTPIHGFTEIYDNDKHTKKMSYIGDALSTSSKQFTKKRNGDIALNVNSPDNFEAIMGKIDKAAEYGNRFHIFNHRRNMPLIEYCRNKGYNFEIFGRADKKKLHPGTKEGYIGYDSLADMTHYYDIKVNKVSGIKTDKDKPVMARINKDRTFMEIDPVALEDGFNRKAWQKGSTQADGSQATPLDDSHFQTKDDWLSFTLMHEAAHKVRNKKANETVGQYEDRVNQHALEALAHHKQQAVVNNEKVSIDDYYIPPSLAGHDWYNENLAEVPEHTVGSKVFAVLTPSAGIESVAPCTIIGISRDGIMHTDNTFFTEYQGRDFDADKIGIVGMGGIMSKDLFNRHFDTLIKMGIPGEKFKDVEGNMGTDKDGKPIDQSPTKAIDSSRESPIKWDKVAEWLGVKSRPWTQKPQDVDYYKNFDLMTAGQGDTIAVRNQIHDLLMDNPDIAREDLDRMGASSMSILYNELVQKAVDTYDKFPYSPKEMMQALAVKTSGLKLKEPPKERKDKFGNIIPAPKDYEPRIDTTDLVDNRKFNNPYKDYKEPKGRGENQNVIKRVHETVTKKAQSFAELSRDAVVSQLSDEGKRYVNSGINYAIGTVKFIAKNMENSMFTHKGDNVRNVMGGAMFAKNTNFYFFENKDKETGAMTKNDLVNFDPKVYTGNPHKTIRDEQGYSLQTIASGTLFNFLCDKFSFDNMENVIVAPDITKGQTKTYIQNKDKIDVYDISQTQNNPKGELVASLPIKELFNRDGTPNKVVEDLKVNQLFHLFDFRSAIKPHDILDLSVGISSNVAKMMNRVDPNINPDVIAPAILYGNKRDKSGNQIKDDKGGLVPDRIELQAIDFSSTAKDRKYLDHDPYGVPEKFAKYDINPMYLRSRGEGKVAGKTHNDVLKETVKGEIDKAYRPVKREAHAMSIASLSSEAYANGRYSLIKKFQSALNDDDEFKGMTLNKIVDDAEAYAKFHTKHITPIIGKMIGTKVPNRDKIVEKLIDLVSPTGMENIASYNKKYGSKAQNIMKGLALAELYDVAKAVNNTKKYNKWTEASLFRSHTVASVLERTAESREAYPLQYAVSQSWKIDNAGNVIHNGDITAGDLIDDAKMINSPILYRSRIDMECVRPLEYLRQDIDKAAQLMEELKVSEIDWDFLDNTKIDVRAGIDEYGDIVDSSIFYPSGASVPLNRTSIKEAGKSYVGNSDNIGKSLEAIHAVRCTGNALTIAVKKLENMRDNMDAQTLTIFNENIKKLQFMADKFRVGSIDEIRQMSLATDLSHSEVADKLGEVINSAKMAHSEVIGKKTAVNRMVEEITKSKLPINITLNNHKYTDAISVAQAYHNKSKKATEIEERELPYFDQFVAERPDIPTADKEKVVAQFYEWRRDKVIADGLKETQAKYSQVSKVLMPDTLEEFLNGSDPFKVSADNVKDYNDILGISAELFGNKDLPKDATKAKESMQTALKVHGKYKFNLEKYGVDLNNISKDMLQDIPKLLEYFQSGGKQVTDPLELTRSVRNFIKSRENLTEISNKYGWLKPMEILGAIEIAKQSDPNASKVEIDGKEYGMEEAYGMYKSWYNSRIFDTKKFGSMNEAQIMDTQKKITEAISSPVSDVPSEKYLAYNIFKELGAPGFERDLEDIKDGFELNQLTQKAQDWLYGIKDRYVDKAVRDLQINDWYEAQGKQSLITTGVGSDAKFIPEELSTFGITPARIMEVFDRISGKEYAEGESPYSYNTKGIIDQTISLLNGVVRDTENCMLSKMHQMGETNPEALRVGSRAIGRGYGNNLIFNERRDVEVDKADIMDNLSKKSVYMPTHAGTPYLVEVRRKVGDTMDDFSTISVIGDCIGYYNRIVKTRDEAGKEINKEIPTLALYDPSTNKIHNIDVDQVGTITQGTHADSFARDRADQHREVYNKQAEGLLRALANDAMFTVKTRDVQAKIGTITDVDGNTSIGRKPGYFVQRGSKMVGRKSNEIIGEVVELRNHLNDIEAGFIEKSIKLAHTARVAESYGLAGQMGGLAVGLGMLAVTGDPTLLAASGFGIAHKVWKSALENTVGVSGGIASRSLGHFPMIQAAVKPAQLLIKLFNPFNYVKTGHTQGGVETQYKDLLKERMGGIVDKSAANMALNTPMDNAKGIVDNLITTVRNVLGKQTSESIANSTFSKQFRVDVKNVKEAQKVFKEVYTIHESILNKMDREGVADAITIHLLNKGMKIDKEDLSIEAIQEKEYEEGKATDWDIKYKGLSLDEVDGITLSAGDYLINYATMNGLFGSMERVSSNNTKEVAKEWIADKSDRMKKFYNTLEGKNIGVEDFRNAGLLNSLIQKSIGDYHRNPLQETALGRHFSVFKHFRKERTLDNFGYYGQRIDTYRAIDEFMQQDKDYMKFCKQHGLHGIVVGNNLLYSPLQEAKNKLPANVLGLVKNGFPKMLLSYGVINAINSAFYSEDDWYKAVVAPLWGVQQSYADALAPVFRDMVNFFDVEDGNYKVNGRRIGQDAYKTVVERGATSFGDVFSALSSLGMGEKQMVELIGIGGLGLYSAFNNAKFSILQTTDSKQTALGNACYEKLLSATGNTMGLILPGSISLGRYASKVYGQVTTKKFKNRNKKDD